MAKDKVETITEKVGEKDGMKYVRVTKWYERRTNLKSISGQFDNVNVGNAVSAVVGFYDQKDLDKKMSKLGQKVLDETERDMQRSITNIISLSKDPNNDALVGLGASAEYKELLSQIDGFDELLGESDGMKMPHGFTEEDF